MIEIKNEIKEQFKVHAQQESPKEACGLVAILKGKQHYFPCKNIAEDANDFILDPNDYIRIDDFVSSYAGEIVAVVHSHPATPARPSLADKVGCEQSGMMWVIHSLQSGEWFSFVPNGFKAPLIGRPFKHGVFDCYSAIRDWYKEKMGIVLLDFPREEEDWWKNGKNFFMDKFHLAGFKAIVGGDLTTGDAFLINIGGDVPNHCAVYIGNDQVFHQPPNRLSSRDIYGGWLKKNTRVILRYAG